MPPISGSPNTATRSPRRRQHSSGVRPPEALEPRDLSRPSAPAPRHLPQRVRFPLQPSLLPPRVLRNDPRPGDKPLTSLLLEHHRTAKPAQERPYTTTEHSAAQDRRRHAAGRRPLHASYRPE